MYCLHGTDAPNNQPPVLRIPGAHTLYQRDHRALVRDETEDDIRDNRCLGDAPP